MALDLTLLSFNEVRSGPHAADGFAAFSGRIASMKIIAGNSNRELAEEVAAHLNQPLAGASVRRFADTEIFVEIEENIRGEDVFLIQSTSCPTNDNLMELLIMLDAAR